MQLVARPSKFELFRVLKIALIVPFNYFKVATLDLIKSELRERGDKCYFSGPGTARVCLDARRFTRKSDPETG